MQLFSISRMAVALAAALALSPAITGCAASNRETYMREHAGEHIYERPLPEVWAAAKQLLADDGYSGREERGGWVYVTEWKESSSSSNVSSVQERFMVEGKELSPSRCTVRFMKITRSSGASGSTLGGVSNNSTHQGMAKLSAGNAGSEGGPMPSTSTPGGITQQSSLASGKRDLDMEWRLLRKIEPKAAGTIEAQALREYPDD